MIIGAVTAAMLTTGIITTNLNRSVEIKAAENDPVIEKVSDPQTDLLREPGTKGSTTDPENTSEVGRIKTDKTVRTLPIDERTQPGQEGTGTWDEAGKNNFQVTFSALSSGLQVRRQTLVPADIVFVLDFSGSMDAEMSSSDDTTRYQAMVESLNTAIDWYLSNNEQNRIAVLAYSGDTTTLFNLGRPVKDSNNRYFWYESNGTPSVYYTGNTSYSREIVGGTNTETGIFLGMEMLRTNNDTTAVVNGQTVNRTPGVILMSDGVPTFIANENNWYQLDEDSGTRGAGNGAYAGNGFMAMLAASYQKNRVAAHYGEDVKLYTIGLGITTLGTNERNLADISLNPKDHFNDNNTMANTVRGYYNNSYNANNNSFTVAVAGSGYNRNYTVTHPTGTLAQYDPKTGASANKVTNLQYNDAYFTADNTEALEDAFIKAVQGMYTTEQGAPVSIDTSTSHSGYVTFTDTVGPLMEIKSVDSILYDSHHIESGHEVETATRYTNVTKTTSGNIDTYVFNDVVNSSWLHNYEEVNLNNVEITVDHSGPQDVITISIPEYLLPMVDYMVDYDGNGEITSVTRNDTTRPIKINYTVGPKGAVGTEGQPGYVPSVIDQISNPSLRTEEVQAYIDDPNNIVEKDGKQTVALYSNGWTGSTDGVVPHVDFTVNPANDFYTFEANTPLYVDQNCTIPVTDFSENSTYYYKKDIFIVGATGAAADSEAHRTVENLTAADISVDSNGNVYAKSGARKGLPAPAAKDENTTETRSYRLSNEWRDGTSLRQRLGNNGRLLVELPGGLEIDKHVTYKDADGNDYDRASLNPSVFNKTFTFRVTLTNANNVPINGTFYLKVTEPSSDGSSQVIDHSRNVEFVNGVAEITLTDAQKATLEGLPDGTKYKVEEINLPAGFELKASSQTEDTIESGNVYDADFTNNYKLDPVTLTSEPHAEKVIQGRGYRTTDQFKVTIEANLDSNPDASAIPDPAYILLDIDGNGTVSGDTIENAFSSITFKEPGTYYYTLREERGTIPGITYSSSVYIYSVTVTDDGEGKLSITDKVMTKVTNPDGSAIPAPLEVSVATFTNTYSVDDTSINASGLKRYTDTTNSKPLGRGDFEFELRPNYTKPYTYNGTDAAGTDENIDKVPMPAEVTGSGTNRKVETFNDIGGNFYFGDIKYTSADIGYTYHYAVQEMISDEAIQHGTHETIDGVDYVVYKGMKYDTTRHLVDVMVEEEIDEGEAHIKATVVFTHGSSQQEGRVVIRNIYDPASAEVEVAGSKVLNGRDSKAGEKFEFSLSGYDPDTRAAMRSGVIELEDGEFVIIDSSPTLKTSVDALTNGQLKTFNFDKMIFNQPGNYRFEVKEDTVGSDGLVTDTTTYIVRVVVEDGGNGSLVVTSHTYNGVDYVEGGDNAKFVNTYSSTITFLQGAVDVGKTLNGRALNPDEFTFTIEALGDAPAVAGEERRFNNPTGSADGIEQLMSRLSDLTFTQDDAGKTYQYKISEVVPEDAVNANGVAYRDASQDVKDAGGFVKDGITYDTESEHILTFEITDNGDGTLTVTSQVDDGPVITSTSSNVRKAKVSFVNTYSPDVVHFNFEDYFKRLEGREWFDTDSFAFELKSDPNNPEGGVEFGGNPEPIVVRKPAEGDTAVISAPGEIIFKKAGTYKFTIEEKLESIPGITYDSEPIELTIVVEDDGHGSLQVVSATTKNNKTTFVNVYHTELDFVGVNVSKTLIGRTSRDREFMVDIRPVDSDSTSAQETSERFEIRTTGEMIIFDSAASGVEKVMNLIPRTTFNNEDAGLTYSFEIKEFVPADAADTAYDGGTYKMRDGVYYNTNGIDHYRLDITLTDNGDGTMSATTKWIPHDKDHNVLEIEGVGGEDTRNSLPVLPFENKYDADGNAVVNAIKDLEGRGLNDEAWTDDDEYEFVIEPMLLDENGKITIMADDEDNIPMPDYNIIATKRTDLVGSDGTQHHAVDPTGKNGWTININESHLTLDPTDGVNKGDFYYRIREVVPADAVNADGIRYDEATEEQKQAGGFVKDGINYSRTYRYVHVHAQDTRTGSITTDTNYVNWDAPTVDLGATPVFTNRYSAKGEVEIPVTKSLVGKNWDENDEYTFTLTASGTAPLPATEGRTVTIDKDTEGKIAKFGKITFNRAGVYDYIITENPGTVPGVEYDSNDKRYVRVMVSDAADGTLNIDRIIYYTDVNYAIEQENQDQAEFVNRYKSEGTIAVEGTKKLIGRDFKSGDMFTFNITGPANAPLPSPASVTISPASNTGNSYDFAFGNITFTQDDVANFPEGIEYTITEVKGDRTVITYDEHAEKIKITLSDDGEGHITPTITYLENEGDESADEILFENEYRSRGSASIRVVKDLMGRPWLNSDSFEFMIVPKTGTPAFDGDDVVINSHAVIDPDSMVSSEMYFASPAWVINLTMDDLTKIDSETGRKYDDFYYIATEVVPGDAVNANGVAYRDAPQNVKDAGGFVKDGITYTNEKHEIHVHAEDNGLGTIITTVEYDQTVPVFTNTYSVPLDSLMVEKQWSDQNDRYKFRTDVTMHLYRYDSEGKLVQVNVEPKKIGKNASPAQARWDDLPVTEWYYDEAESVYKSRTISYVVLEESVAGYKTIYTYGNTTSESGVAVGLDGDKTTVQKTLVTNTLDTVKTSVEAKKVWDDDNNRDGKRPTSVTFELYQDDEPTGRTVELDGTVDEGTSDDRETAAWTATFSNLQMTKVVDGNVVPVKYSVMEASVPTGYTSITTGCASQGITITNTYVPETISANVTKVWNDQNDSEKLRPKYMHFELYKRVDGTESRVNNNSYAVTEKENWKLTVEGLPKYENGKEITYFFKEVLPQPADQQYTADGYGENNAFVNSNGTITNTHEPGKVTINVEKHWADNNNAEGSRPTTLTVYLLANGTRTGASKVLNEAGGWKDTFTDLPAVVEGVTVNYTVEEVVPEGYRAAISRSGNTFTITNTHEKHTIDLDGEKVWNDAGNEFARPESITVNLLADGENVKDEFDENVSKTVTAQDDWKWSFTDLPEFAQDGHAIEYTAEEVDIPGYTKKETMGGKVIINTPNTLEATVKKYWDDASNKDGVRPKTIEFKLMREYGEPGDLTVEEVQTVTMTGPTNSSSSEPWTAKVENLPDYIKGYKVTYYWIETVPQGYEANGTGDEHNQVANNGSIINKHVTELVEVSVSKTWEDDENRDGKRPTSIEYKLYSNGAQAYDTYGNEIKATVGEADNWAYTFSNLPKYSKGAQIVYTVVETAVGEGYVTTYGGNMTDGLTVTNTRPSELITIFGSKTWHDDGDESGRDKIYVTLQKKNEAGEWVNVENNAHRGVDFKDNGWDFLFENVYKYENGREIEYRVIEEDVDGYVTRVLQDADGTWTVINNQIIEISGEKIWRDGDLTIEHEPVEIQLKANGSTAKDINGDDVENVETDSDNKYKFSNLPAFDEDGKRITYTVDEVEVPEGYEKTIDGYNIINTLKEKTVSVTKVWDDNDNADDTRSAVKIHLDSTAGNTVTESVKTFDVPVDAEGEDLTAEWQVPVYDSNGVLIKYSVRETDVPDKYEVTIKDNGDNTFTVTNKYVPDEVVTIKVTKVWDDNDSTETRRDVKVHLFATAGDWKADFGEKTIAKDADPLETSWVDMPKYHYGQEITYEVKEDAVPLYMTRITHEGNDWTITNTYAPSTENISATKVWDDKDDLYGARPDSVTFYLESSNDGGQSWNRVEDSDRVIENADEDIALWENLPQEEIVEEEVKSIIYRVKEEDPGTNYVTTVEAGNEPGTYVVTNTYIPPVTQLKATKVWVDEDNKYKERPASITFVLMRQAEGEEAVEVGRKVIYGSATGDDLSVTWSDLPTYVDNKPVTYSVKEEGNGKYAVGYDDSDPENWIITNTYSVDKTSVTAVKEWIDLEGNTMEESPADITLQLIKTVNSYGSTVAGEKTIPAGSTGDDLSVTWSDLPTIEDGYQVTYSVEEKFVEGYATTIEYDEDEKVYKVTNTQIEPPETIFVAYVDPLNAASSQIVKSDLVSYGKQDDVTPPEEDPSHEGYVFAGWDKNTDTDTGNLIYVARFEQPKQMVVTYIDPKNNNDAMVLKSELTNDPESVTIDVTPSHSRSKFTGWQLTKDTAGNWIYVAKYQEICPDAPDCDKCPIPTTDTYVIPRTGVYH